MNDIKCSACRPHQVALNDLEYQAARDLAHAGNPIGVLDRSDPRFHAGEFNFHGRKRAEATCRALSRYSHQKALIMLTGHGLDVIDVDHRNGGGEPFSQLEHLIGEVLARVETPSGSFHVYVSSTGYRSMSVGGIDYLAEGRFVYLPGTLRPKYNGKGYRWTQMPSSATTPASDEFPKALDRLRALSHSTHRATPTFPKPTPSLDRDLHGPERLLALSYFTALNAPRGSRNQTLYRVACAFAIRFGTHGAALAQLHDALVSAARENNLLLDDGPASVSDTIASGINAGLEIGEAV